MLHHEHAVADADAERPAAGPLTDDHADDRHAELHHFHDVPGDGLALSALLGLQAGVGTRGVDQADHRAIELLGELHQAECLPVAFRIGHAEVAVLAELGVGALLLANEHDGQVVDHAESAHHGLVVLAVAVPVEFHEPAVRQGLDVVQGVGPVGVAGNLHALPRAQVGVDLLTHLGNLLFEVGHGALHVDLALAVDVLCLLHLLPEQPDGLFEIEVVHGHSVSGCRMNRKPTAAPRGFRRHALQILNLGP